LIGQRIRHEGRSAMMTKTKTEIFEGGDKQTALDLAEMWISNQKTHGPVFVQSLVTTQRGDKWVATLTYRVP
jgi:hypothetical protein